MWWYPYKVTRGYQTPDPNRGPIEAPQKPPGNWWGPFHCRACAIDCGSFGKLPESAYLANHGTDDERFGAFLSFSE